MSSVSFHIYSVQSPAPDTVARFMDFFIENICHIFQLVTLVLFTRRMPVIIESEGQLLRKQYLIF